MFKTETHLHTMEVSQCGHVRAKKMVNTYKELGYSTIFVTDHLQVNTVDAYGDIPWKDKKSAGNCVVLDPKGIWKHENCKSVKDGAICYKPTECKT